jgi:hypothetical protein
MIVMRVEKTGGAKPLFLLQLLLDKPRVPLLELFSKLIIKNASADLKQQMSSPLAPAHLLLFGPMEGTTNFRAEMHSMRISSLSPF